MVSVTNFASGEKSSLIIVFLSQEEDIFAVAFLFVAWGFFYDASASENLTQSNVGGFRGCKVEIIELEIWHQTKYRNFADLDFLKTARIFGMIG